jgi:hypothetical protein
MNSCDASGRASGATRALGLERGDVLRRFLVVDVEEIARHRHATDDRLLGVRRRRAAAAARRRGARPASTSGRVDFLLSAPSFSAAIQPRKDLLAA